MAQVKQFEVGKMYKMNSACDSDCWWYYKVMDRTASTVLLVQVRKDGTMTIHTKRCRINKKETERFGYESVSPLGKYSMSPVLSADNEYKIK